MAMKNALLFALLVASLPCAVQAEVRPSAGYRDNRVKSVAYDPNDVVLVIGRYGYSTVIEFAEGEAVTDVALGDSLAWEVSPSRNNVFVKPREDRAATNMTVVTDKRIYHFMLQAGAHTNASPKDAFFAVRFLYPQQEAAAREAAAEAERAKAAIAVAPKPVNWDYWVCGAVELRPTEVYDDGRFTYLKFPGAQEIPAVFLINADNTESLANGQIRGDQFVVFATARKLMLRKGKSVACVENRSFNWYGIYNTTGTTSPQVTRTVQGVAPVPPSRTVPRQDAPEPMQDDGSATPVPTPFLPVPGPAAPLPTPAGTPAQSGAVVSPPLHHGRAVVALWIGRLEVLHAKHGEA